MPEGDTIHRHAAELRPLLVGRALVEVRTRGVAVPALAGAKVLAVEARGKHLLITVEREAVIHVHLGMTGRWWRAARPGFADLALVLDDGAIVWRAKVVEILRAKLVHAHPAFVALGPDVLGATLDLDEVVARARRLDPATALAELLLDQKVASGIGNIWKNETLHAERRHPQQTLGALDDAALRALYARARELMRAGREPRVYRRRGMPCPTCGGAISGTMDADTMRQTFWCPACQR